MKSGLESCWKLEGNPFIHFIPTDRYISKVLVLHIQFNLFEIEIVIQMEYFIMPRQWNSFPISLSLLIR